MARRTIFLSVSPLAMLAVATTAHAQDVDPADPQPQEMAETDSGATDTNDIIVTGSRIARRDYVSNSPISTVGSGAVEATGSSSIDTALIQMPQFTASTGSTTNSNGNGGQANIQLRGLGRSRTLVLLEGRRLPAANSDGSVDVNLIPTVMIDNVEVITGGASAVYGSDAIAGVVNFKLRRSIEGIEIAGQYGISDEGDAADRKISIAGGTKFADGRGNVMFSAEYAKRDLIYVSERPWTFGFPRDSVLPDGFVTFAANNQPTQAALNSVFAQYGVPGGAVRPGNNIGFNLDGSLFSTGLSVRNYRGSTDPNYITSNGVSLLADSRRFRPLQLPLERYTAFGKASYEFSDALTVFAQGLYSHSVATTQLNPSPSPGNSGISGVPVTNPFIPADLAALLASRPNPTATFDISLRPDQLGGRTADYTYETFQAVIGIEGKLPLGDWTYSLNGIYGSNNIDLVNTNWVTGSRINALVRAPDGGNSICAGGFNPFGDRPVSDACRAYFSPKLYGSSRLRQKIAEATVQGGLFDLPGGDVRAALGASYRKDSYANVVDPAIAAGDVFSSQGQTFSGAIDVKELYAELSLPILADTPFFHALNLDLAYRLSDYSTVGSIHTYKADGYWEPFRGLRFRGGYERAVRAPNIGEIFQPQTTNFAIIGLPGSFGSGDPCDINGAYLRGAGAAGVRALCLAQGVPNLLIDQYTSAQQAIRVRQAGNPALKEETADTFSVGAVITPKFSSSLFHDFSLSVDYYSINLKDAVGNITSNISLARCFNSDGVSNPNYDPANFFCSLTVRDGNTGTIFETQELKFNLGGYKTSGIDIQASWRTDLEAFGLGANSGTLAFNFVGSYLDTFKIKSLPGDPYLDYAGTIGNGQIDPVAISRPKFKSTVDVNYTIGDFRAGMRWRLIGKQRNAANVGTNGTAVGVEAVSYFDLNAGIKVSEMFDLWGTINNLTDRIPPVYPSAGSTDLATYDAIGRRYTVGIKARF